MIGHIESFDPETQTGVIKSDDNFFEFHLDDWIADVPPDQGDDVRFDGDNGKAANVNLVGAYLEKPKAVKSKLLAGLLSFFCGWTGLSRLYLGYYRLAVIQIVLTVILVRAGFIVFVPQWGFIEAVLLFSGKLDKDAKGRPLK